MRLYYLLTFMFLMFGFYVRSEWDDFKSDFIEDKTSSDSNNVTNFCSENICFIDSARMLKWIDSSVELCSDFYNFTCGSFMKFKPLHERYTNEGIERIAVNSLDNKIRNFLTEQVQDDDELSIRFAKSFFQKCVDRDYIENKSPWEYLKFIDRFGWGFPLLEGARWNSKNFTKFKIFKEYPELWREFFGHIEVRKGNENENFDIFIGKWNFYRNYYLKYKKESDFPCRALAKVFRITDAHCSNRYDNIEKTDIEYFRKYPVDYDIEFKYHYSDVPFGEAFEEELQDDESTTSILMTFNELNKYFHEHTFIDDDDNDNKFDLKVLFEELLGKKINDDQIVKISHLQTWIKQIRWLLILDNGNILNWFYANMFSKFPAIFQFYPEIDPDIKYYFKQKRSYQRHEQCLYQIERNFPYIIPFISQRMTGEWTRNYVNNTFMRVAMLQKAIIEQSNDSQHDKLKMITDIDEVLRSEYFPSVLPKFDLGDHARILIENFMKNNRIDELHRVMSEGRAFRDRNVKKSDGFVVFKDGLTLSVFPYLHADRPRYLNDAFFAPKLFNMLRKRVGILKNENEYDAIFKAYSKWDDEEKSDKPLPGINFTNKQMFWFSLTHFNCYKAKEKQADIKNATIIYTGSKEYMRHEFGCETYPGFVENKDHDALQDISFIKVTELEKLGLKIV